MLLALLAGPTLHVTVVETIEPPNRLRGVWCEGDPTVLLAHTDRGLERWDGEWTVVEPDIEHSGQLHGGGAAWVRWSDGERQIGVTEMSGRTTWTAELDRLSATWVGVAVKRTGVPLTVLQLHTQSPRVVHGQASFRVAEYGDTRPLISPDGTQILFTGPFYVGVTDLQSGQTQVLEDFQASRDAAWGPRGALWSGADGLETKIRYGLDDRRTWDRTFTDPVQSTVWLDDPGLWLVTTRGSIHALDPRDGSDMSWKGGDLERSAPALRRPSTPSTACGPDTVLAIGDDLELWQITRSR